MKQLVRLRHHPSINVRFCIVRGLTGLRDDRAIAALIDLTGDEAELIRDWATFGLGRVGNTTSKVIRAALWARIEDVDPIVRAEALAGLVTHKAKGTIAALTSELRKDDVYDLVIETAGEVADPQLLPALLELRNRYTQGMSFSLDQLDEAIRRCSA